MQQREQQRYQQTRDPFEYGRQVAQRRYSEIMSGLDAQGASIQRSYGDMYQAARQRAIGQQAAGGPTLSGGMGQQQRDFVSALELQELGKIGAARDQATRDLFTQAQSAMSNAQLEGQQATQMQLQNQTAQLQLVQQKQAILDSDLSEEQKAEQLVALGVDPSEVPEEKLSFGQFFGQALGAGAGVLAAGSIGSGILQSFMVSTPAIKSAVGIKATYTALSNAGVSGFIGKGIASAVISHPYVAAGLAVFAIGGLIYAGIRSANQD